MARFHAHEFGKGLVLDTQANLLDGFNTRVVVPLLPEHEIKRRADRLNPIFEIDGTIYVMVTQFLAAVPLAEIGAEIADLSHHSDEITAAIDFLFQGF